MSNFDFLSYIVDGLADTNWGYGCQRVIFNEDFQKGWGSHGKHHAYSGGLVDHTAEVVQLALTKAGTEGLDKNSAIILSVAGIYHDFAKIHDYTEKGEKTPYRNLVRHVSGSHAYFINYCLRNYINPNEGQALQIQHCILSHHGKQEWGSPVIPQTPEAVILHWADMESCGGNH